MRHLKNKTAMATWRPGYMRKKYRHIFKLLRLQSLIRSSMIQYFWKRKRSRRAYNVLSQPRQNTSLLVTL